MHLKVMLWMILREMFSLKDTHIKKTSKLQNVSRAQLLLTTAFSEFFDMGKAHIKKCAKVGTKDVVWLRYATKQLFAFGELTINYLNPDTTHLSDRRRLFF